MLKIQAIGRLGADAVKRNFHGKDVLTFPLVHNERYRDQAGEKQERSVWLDCTCYVPQLEGYLKKGKAVFIEGVPWARSYEKADGSNAASINVKILTIELI